MAMRGRVARGGLAAAIAAAALALFVARGRLNAAGLATVVSGLGAWAPAVFVAGYALATVLFVPGLALTIAGGALFGPLWGTVLNLAGATAGATLAFLAARYLAADLVARRAGGRLERLTRGVESEGWRFVAFVRLVPLFPFNLVNYAFGLTRIGLRPYVVASAVCMLPAAIAYTYLGYAGRQAAAGNPERVRVALVALGLLGAVALLPRLVRRLRSEVEFIDCRRLKEQLDASQEILVLDVREPGEFNGPLGHIPEARNIPLGELGARLPELGEFKPRALTLVCLTDKRSATAAVMLRQAGIERVAVLRGGMKAWHEAGFPVQGAGAREDAQPGQQAAGG